MCNWASNYQKQLIVNNHIIHICSVPIKSTVFVLKEIHALINKHGNIKHTKVMLTLAVLHFIVLQL